MVNVASDSSRYGLLKNSGVGSLGVIPQHWKISRFRNLFSFDKGLNITKDDLQDAGVPCINYGDVHSRFGFEVNPENNILKCVSEDFLKVNPRSLLRVGDFIFADTSEDIEGSGNFSQLTGGGLVFSGYHTIIARPIGECAKRYLAYMLDSVAFRDQVRCAVKGVKVYSITQSILKNPSIWLPPIAEQELIAGYLDRKLVDVSQAIKIKERQIERLKERKQILIQQTVTRGLDSNAPMRDSGIEWIGEIPAHWQSRRFKNLFSQSQLPVRPGDGVVTSYRDGQVTLRSNRRLSGYTEAILEGGYQGVRKGQLVLNSMDAFEGAIGVSESDGKCTPEYVVCDALSDEYLPEYFAYLLREMALARYIQVICNAVRQRAVRIRFNNLASRFMVVPPIEEQRAIVAHIKAETDKQEAAVALLEQQISKLKEYKATLINSAVTGKIKVPGVVEPTEIEEREIA